MFDRRFNNRWVLVFKKATVLLLVTLFLFSDTQSLFKFAYLPSVQKAEASTGDIAIFRESTGTKTVPSDGTPYDVTWDTTVQSNANIALQTNQSDIDLSDGGKYLVLYSAWTEVGTSTGTNRRATESYLTLNGTESAYGRASGFIRASNGINTAYAAGGTIISATAGDSLQLHIKRTDTNTTAGTNVPANTNGISVIKLKDSWDYLRIRKSATSSDISGNTSFTNVTWDTSDEADSGSFAFTPTSGNITLKGPVGSHFYISSNIDLYNGGGGGRQNYEMQLALDGTEIPGTRVTTYPRGTDGVDYGTLSYTGIITKTSAADQTLTIQERRESSASNATVIMGNRASVAIAKFPDTAEYVMLNDSSGTQALSASRVPVTFNTNSEVDTTAFTHSTTSNPSRVTINKNGNYLFFTSAYDTTVTGTTRQPDRIDLRKNGSSLIQYGSHGAYNRDTGTNSAGSSGGAVVNGLTTSDYIEMTQVDESTTAPVDATFDANRIALQGVLLNDNFFGTDVVVSANGTHTTEADIPSSNVQMGGQFVIQEQSSSRSLTNITLTETGSVDGQTGINNIKIFYDYDTTAPYDCASESYNGTESQFGSTDTNGFSGPDGVSSFSGSATISTTQAFCGYVVYDVTASSTDANTVNIGIADPATDITVSGGASVGPLMAVAPTGSTDLKNAELTQLHYNWRNDDGSETTATSIDGAQDTPAIGFANGTIRRLRLEVAAEGSTSSPPVQYRLEYAQKLSSCSAATGWTDVGTGGGGDWDVVNSPNLSDGADTTNVASQSLGGVADPPGKTFLTTNGGQKDSSSQTGALILSDTQFVELEYAIEPTSGAPQGNTYCFRLSDAGAPLRNYSMYPEGTISADIDVSASGTHRTSLDAGTTTAYVGGAFVIKRSGTSRTLTGVTVTENGTIDAATYLSNPRLYYDLDTTAPYDCSAQSYSPSDGFVSGSAFIGANGSTTFSGSVALNSTQSFCGYIVVDVASNAPNGQSIKFQISNPSSDVIVTSSTVGPSSVVSPSGSTTVSGPILDQTHYHWRNDDGSETTATAAVVSEDTPLLDLPKNSPRRLRLQVANDGSVSSASSQYRLEYGTKITTCSAVGTWTDVGAAGGAFDMVNSANLTDGNNTTNIGTTTGGTSDPSGYTFLSANSGVKDTSSQTSGDVLAASQFSEFEYSIQATADSGYDTDYCFRLTDASTPLQTYTSYAELTTRAKQDFYVQRGVSTITGTSTTLVAGIDYTAPTASTTAFIRITNTQMTGAGNNTGGGNQSADAVTAYIVNPGNIASSVTIARAGTTANTRVDWEIVEFIGLAGSDNEMIVRDQKSMSFSSGSLFATGTALSNIGNDSNVAVFITGQYNPDTTTSHYNRGLATAKWDSTLHVPVFQRGDSGTATGVSYAVVEFSGANWKVQRISHTYAAGGTVETEAISAVNSLNHTFIQAQKRVGTASVGLDEFGHEVWLSSIGVLSFELQSSVSTPSDHVSVVWVVENTQTNTGAMNVYRSSGTLASGAGGGAEPLSEMISIGGTLSNITNASIFANNSGGGTGNAYPRTIVAARIASTTAYEMWRSDTGQAQSFRTEIIEWPVADTALRQNYYRLYANTNSIHPTDPWPVGAVDLGENTAMTSLDDPIAETEVVRIRMNALVGNADLPDNTQSYKLQYGKRLTTCSAIATWTDVGAIGSGEIWRGYDNGGVTDGTTLSTSTLSNSDVLGTYEEQNNSAVNPFAVSVGENIEYDWVVQHNGAQQRTDYCFRMVNSDGSTFASYYNYPTLRTTGYTPVQANWRWYDDVTSSTPTDPLANENTAPIDITNGNDIKLRVGVHETENAAGSNVHFALQYSEYSDFSDGGHWVNASSTCTENSIWCYADGGGTDKSKIDSAVLSDSDACVAGVGNGCGDYNEGTTTPSTLAQPAGSKMEFDYTLHQAGARANAIYYFRLYDLANDDVVLASSSYPSVITEGAQLIFSVSGLPSGTSTEGVVTDASSSPLNLSFGDIPIDTPYTIANRLRINTNATEGYQVFMYADQQLQNSYGVQIDPISSSNANPKSWAVACSATSTSCFGYHAGDDSLSGNSARFAANDSFAPLSTIPKEVMYSSIPINDAHDIVYKILIRDGQRSGTYKANVSYIAIPVF